MIYYLSLRPETPNKDYWDMALIEDLFLPLANEVKEVSSIPVCDKAIVILPARHHKGMEREVNAELNKVKKVVFVACGDEEAEFDNTFISHPDILHIVQNAHPGIHNRFMRIGTGYAPHTRQAEYHEKDLDVFFSGQITHDRRIDMWKHLNPVATDKWLLNRTGGFTQGLNPKDYITNLSRAKVAPAPSGAVIPDSFRLFEALECMAIPIADEVNPSHTIESYWDWLFDCNTPFPKIKEWSQAPSIIEEVKDDLQLRHKITCWWIKWKRDFRMKVEEHLNE